MVFGLSKDEREERKHQRQLDKAADRQAESARRDARRVGKIKGAQKRGYKEGLEQGKKEGGGILGALQSAAKHIEIGPSKGKSDYSDFGFGGSPVKAEDFGFGAPTRKKGKGKKEDPYADLGL